MRNPGYAQLSDETHAKRHARAGDPARIHHDYPGQPAAPRSHGKVHLTQGSRRVVLNAMHCPPLDPLRRSTLVREPWTQNRKKFPWVCKQCKHHASPL